MKQIVIRKPEVDGIGNVLKGFISAFSVYSNTVVECNRGYVFGSYDTILDDRHIFNEKDKNPYYFRTCRLLVLASEEDVQQHISNEFQCTDRGSSIISPLYSDRVLIDWNYDVNKIDQTVRDRILRTIDQIVFRNDVINMYGRLKTHIFGSLSQNALGVSVRTWKCHHERDIDRPYYGDVYKNKIREVVENKPINMIVLSTDNDSVNDEYVSYCKSLKPNMKVVVLNDEELKNAGMNSNPLQHVLLKIWILSNCNDFICNRISTFSELVFWFGRCRQTIYPLF